jgi:hypothetical protein
MSRKWLCFFLLLLSAWARAENKPDYIALYMEVLAYHAQHPELLKATQTKPFNPVPREVLERLNPNVLKSHILKYVKDYIAYQENIATGQSRLDSMTREIRGLPLTNVDQRPKLEMAIKSQKDKIAALPLALFSMSLKANEDLADSLIALPPEARTAVALKPNEKPKMPGVFGGSFEARMKQKPDEKIFLTPVDDEFYETQLGKKVEKDFGGRAEYWSYNYEDDELYLRVKGDTGRITVIKDQGNTRFIRARSGSDFSVIRGPDERVDLLKAKGRFLTGDKDEEALFGDMPKQGPNILDERKGHENHKRDR